MPDEKGEKIYLTAILVLFWAGIDHAKFILLDVPSSTWTWHLYQWLPLLSGAFAFGALGWVFRLWLPLRTHSFFGWFGLISAPFAAAGLGYVLGYHII